MYGRGRLCHAWIMKRIILLSLLFAPPAFAADSYFGFQVGVLNASLENCVGSCSLVEDQEKITASGRIGTAYDFGSSRLALDASFGDLTDVSIRLHKTLGAGSVYVGAGYGFHYITITLAPDTESGEAVWTFLYLFGLDYRISHSTTLYVEHKFGTSSHSTRSIDPITLDILSAAYDADWSRSIVGVTFFFSP